MIEILRSMLSFILCGVKITHGILGDIFHHTDHVIRSVLCKRPHKILVCNITI